MKIRLVAFASAAEAIGAGELELEVAEGSRASDLEPVLLERYPELGPIWGRLAVAVDGKIGAEDAPLGEGAEVALLPPVSGGAPVARPVTPRERLTDDPIDARAVAEEVAGPGRGALVVFEGRARDSFEGRAVTGLTYDAYRPMAERVLQRIVSELEAAEPGLAVEICHRLGEVTAGETSVVIAAASPHREAAYRASREALERLKREVPIWKRERFAEGDAVWREAEPLAAPGGR